MLELSLNMRIESTDEAKQLAEDSLNIFRSLDNKWWVCCALGILSQITFSSVVESKKFAEESLAILRTLGNMGFTAGTLEALSRLAARQCQFEEAEEMLYEALAIYTELDDRLGAVGIYGTLGTVLVWQGGFREARSILREILATNIDLAYTQSYGALIHARAGFPDQYMREYDAARNQAQHAIDLFREAEVFLAFHYGTALAISILGRVALAEGSYAEAEGWFNECIPVFQSIGVPPLGQELACLGYVFRGLNLIPQARGYFFEALRTAAKDEDFLPLLHALPGIALLFADQWDSERAVELYALAATQGIVANSRWFDDIAGDHIAAVADGLPTDIAEAAGARGRGLDLWETAARLLVELEELGWAGADQ